MSKDIARQFPFTIEGEPFDWPEEKVTAKRIIAFAKDKGIPVAQGKIENLTLKGSKETIYSGDDWVDLSRDNVLTLGVKDEEKIYRFKVNGQELESALDKLVASDIIKLAHEKGVPVPGKPEDFLLAVVGEDDKKFKSDEWVDLRQFNTFILLPNTSTPVAS